MKISVIFGVLVIAAFASAEFCSHDDDCTLTTCGQGQKVDCWKDGDRGHVCTCIPCLMAGHDQHQDPRRMQADGDQSNGISCTTAVQCTQHYDRCKHNDHLWHCFDNSCRCKF